MSNIQFDQTFYLTSYPDVAAAVSRGQFSSAQDHYNQFGRFEGRDPNAFFDTSDYLGRYADVANAGVNPFDHFLTFGAAEGRFANNNIDGTIDTDGNNSANEFDTAAYLAANPDLGAAGITASTAFQHYQLFGQFESRPGVQLTDGTAISGPFTNNGSGGGTPSTGTTFTLSNGIDGSGAASPATNTDGTAGNDTYNGVIQNNNGTFNTGDSINGGSGVDTLKIIVSAANNQVIPASLLGVEVISVQDLDGAQINLINADGVKTIVSDSGTNTTNLTNVNALVDVAFTNSTGGLDIDFDASVTAGATTAVDVAITGSTAFVALDGVETINVTATDGTGNIVGSSLTMGSTLTTLNIAGAGALAVGGLGATLTTVAAATATGDLTIDLANTGDVVVTTGAGDDRLFFGSSLSVDDTVDGGAGFDEVRVNFPVDLSAADDAAPFNALTGIEKVAFDGNGVTLNGSTFTNAGITNIEFNTITSGGFTGDDTINNAGSARIYEIGSENDGAATFNLNATATSINIDLLGGTGPTPNSATDDADVGALAINLSGTAPAGATVTVSLTSEGDLVDAAAGVAGVFNDVGVVTAAAGSTFNIDGSGNLDIVGFANSAIVNASTFTGNLVIEGSQSTQAVAAVAPDVAPVAGVVGVDANNDGDFTDAGDTAPVTPVAGVDNNGDNDFVDAGNAATAFVSGADTITLGIGRDTVQFSSALDSGVTNTTSAATTNAGPIVDVITGFTAGAAGDVLDFGPTNATADYTAITTANQAQINALAGAGATLQAAADIAANISTLDVWTAFSFQGQSYALHTGDNNADYNSGTDLLVQLTGVSVAALTDDNFA